ncbi:hypothetical protein [Gordonia sihwensis]|uniref:hypothetical protein n=1 Tax=Gordonia sihwensis TaxID=173559 RepID=UPI003D97AE26
MATPTQTQSNPDECAAAHHVKLVSMTSNREGPQRRYRVRVTLECQGRQFRTSYSLAPVGVGPPITAGLVLEDLVIRAIEATGRRDKDDEQFAAAVTAFVGGPLQLQAIATALLLM